MADRWRYTVSVCACVCVRVRTRSDVISTIHNQMPLGRPYTRPLILSALSGLDIVSCLWPSVPRSQQQLDKPSSAQIIYQIVQDAWPVSGETPAPAVTSGNALLALAALGGWS